jgi:hypothetical protein
MQKIILSTFVVLTFVCGCKMNTTRIGIRYDDGLLLRGGMYPWDPIGTPLEKRHIGINEIIIDPNFKCGPTLKNLPDIYIGLPSGEKYRLRDLDSKKLESMPCRIEYNDGRWVCENWYKCFNIGSNPDCYDSEYWTIIVDASGNIYQVRSGPYKYDAKEKYRPVIWDSQLKKKYILPLTWKDVTELFGKPVNMSESLVF